MQVAHGLRIYFDKALQQLLLYAKEQETASKVADLLTSIVSTVPADTFPDVSHSHIQHTYLARLSSLWSEAPTSQACACPAIADGVLCSLRAAPEGYHSRKVCA